MTDVLAEIRAYCEDLDEALVVPTAERARGAAFLAPSPTRPNHRRWWRSLVAAAVLVVAVGALVWLWLPRADLAPIDTVGIPAPTTEPEAAPSGEQIVVSASQPLDTVDGVVVAGSYLFTHGRTGDGLRVAWTGGAGWEMTTLDGVEGTVRSIIASDSADVPIAYVATRRGVWFNGLDGLSRVDLDGGPDVYELPGGPVAVTGGTAQSFLVWSLVGDRADLLPGPPAGAEFAAFDGRGLFSIGVNPQPIMVWRSDDGASWSERTLPMENGVHVRAGMLFVSEGSPSGRVTRVSEDGFAWDEIEIPPVGLQDLRRAGSRWVASELVDAADGRQLRVMVSDDLQSWSEVPLAGVPVLPPADGQRRHDTFALEDGRFGFYLHDLASGDFDVWIWDLDRP